MTQHIIDPLLTEQAELIVEDEVSANPTLRDRMLTDVTCMSDSTKRAILSAMLKMHKEIHKANDREDRSLLSQFPLTHQIGYNQERLPARAPEN